MVHFDYDNLKRRYSVDLTFRLLRNEKREIAGFSLVAGGKAWAEKLCQSIGDEISEKGTAVITVESGKVTFQGSRPYSVAIDQEAEAALKLLLADPKKLSLYSTNPII